MTTRIDDLHLFDRVFESSGGQASRQPLSGNPRIPEPAQGLRGRQARVVSAQRCIPQADPAHHLRLHQLVIAFARQSLAVPEVFVRGPALGLAGVNSIDGKRAGELSPGDGGQGEPRPADGEDHR
jgi:hypothetical protein